MHLFEFIQASIQAAPAAAGGLLDPTGIINAVGLIGIVAIIFAESGLLIGFFLPGDSLLFTAGALIAVKIFKPFGDTDPTLSFIIVAGLCFVAAIAGDSVGYYFGHKVGPRLFNKEESLFFQRKHIYRAQAFYEKHGGKTIVLARFLPVVRTFAPIVAGIGQMNYRKFLFFNVIGGFAWAGGVTTLGFLLGRVIGDDIDKYLLPLVVLIIFISVAPTAWHILKERENREALSRSLKSVLNRKSGSTTVETETEPVASKSRDK